MTPTTQALQALSGWPNPISIHTHPGAYAARHNGITEVLVTLRLDPDEQWRCHVRSGGLTLGSGTAATPEAALEQAENAARERLAIMVALLG